MSGTPLSELADRLTAKYGKPSEENDEPVARVVHLPIVEGSQVTRDQFRSRRKREVRSKTINVNRLPKHVIELGRTLSPDVDVIRPTTRSDCVDGHRPCPFVSCKYNLYLDVDEDRGSIKLNFPDIEPDEMKQSCALDVADAGAVTLEVAGELVNITRERIRQIETKAIDLVRIRARRFGLDAWKDAELGTSKSPDEDNHGGAGIAAEPTDPEDERWDLVANRADRAYERRLIERGLAKPQGSWAPNAEQIVTEIEKRIEVEPAPSEPAREQPSEVPMNSFSDRLIGAFGELERELGCQPNRRQLAERMKVGVDSSALNKISIYMSTLKRSGKLKPTKPQSADSAKRAESARASNAAQGKSSSVLSPAPRPASRRRPTARHAKAPSMLAPAPCAPLLAPSGFIAVLQSQRSALQAQIVAIDTLLAAQGAT